MGNVTKWDLSSPEEREILERSPDGAVCTGCGLALPTQADFAKHFILYNKAFLNLGYCPVAGDLGLSF